MMIKALSGLIFVCVSCAVRPLRVVSGVVAALLPRSVGRRSRFVNGLDGFVDGATYEFLHDGGSACVRTFFRDMRRAKAHATDSFTLATGCGCPGLKSFQMHLPSGEPLPPGTGAWQNASNFFGPSSTARIRLVA